MSGSTIERLADQLAAMPEADREALLASLTAQQRSVRPVPQVPSRSLPAARTEAVVTCQIEWT